MTDAPPLASSPIVLFCDFGLPYVGQMKARLHAQAPGHPVIDLMWDAPAYNVPAASVLLAVHAPEFPSGAVFVAVVDPGVGTAARKPGAVFAGGRWFVGPLNGLFEHVLRRWPEDARAYEIVWRPERLSATFHGRDLFSPMAARIARGQLDGLAPLPLDGIRHTDCPDDVEEIIYVDSFGNLMTGIRANHLKSCQKIEVAGRSIAQGQTFGEVGAGDLFWYENSVGLVEIAANLGSAQKMLEIHAGTRVKVSDM